MAALSPQRQLTLLAEIYRCASDGAQFIIATHSPILLGIPNAEIFSFDNGKIHTCRYEETESYKVTELFINSRERLLENLLDWWFEKIFLRWELYLHEWRIENSIVSYNYDRLLSLLWGLLSKRTVKKYNGQNGFPRVLGKNVYGIISDFFQDLNDGKNYSKRQISFAKSWHLRRTEWSIIK